MIKDRIFEGALLPECRQSVQIEIKNGQIVRKNVRPLAQTPSQWISPGLVDGHVHLCWTEENISTTDRLRLIQERRDVFSQQGTCYLRDMGELDSTLQEAILSGDGGSIVIPCGRMVMPYGGFEMTPTHPENLLQTIDVLSRQGNPWIKIFADWTDDFGGSKNPGFGAADQPCYSIGLLSEAVAIAHRNDCKVATHCFTLGGAEASVLSKVDSIEHGWGLNQALLRNMAEHKIAWLPLLSMSKGLRWGAQQQGHLDRVQWIDSSLDRLKKLIPYAQSIGVSIITGTDWGPGITAAQEVSMLHQMGLAPTEALACATTTAADCFQLKGFELGEPATLLVFRENPLDNLQLLQQPDIIIIDGYEQHKRAAPLADAPST